MQSKESGSVIVSWDFSEKDKGVLLVGRQKNRRIEIVNAFQGEEALSLYEKLVKNSILGKNNER